MPDRACILRPGVGCRNSNGFLWLARIVEPILVRRLGIQKFLSLGGTVRPRSLDDFLKHAHVPFTCFQHAAAFTAQQQAALSHVPGRSWAKTVICFAGDEAIAAVVPAHLMVDLDTLRVLANAETLRLAREQELADICPDCELGAVSPFTTRWGLRV